MVYGAVNLLGYCKVWHKPPRNFIQLNIPAWTKRQNHRKVATQSNRVYR